MKELTFDDIETYCLDVDQKILRGECSNMNESDLIFQKMKEMLDCFLKVDLIISKDVRKRIFKEAIMKSIETHGLIVPTDVVKNYKDDIEKTLYFILE